MPEPRENEGHDDFIDRCIPVVIGDGTAADGRQARAVCESIWERNQDKSEQDMDPTDRLLEAVQQRQRALGITTADRYVAEFAKCVGAGLCSPIGGMDAMLKRAQRQLVYSGPGLSQEKASKAAFADLLPDGVEAPKNTLMVIHHKVTTPREDRDRDVLVTEGAELDPRSPLLWQHMQHLPLGSVVATLEHTPEVLRTATALLDINQLTHDAAVLVEADALRFSHGFRALEFEEREGESGDGEGPMHGFRVTKFEIMEVSLVSVPSNVDAEIELYSRGKLHSAEMKSHAKHYWDARQKSVAGADIPCTCRTKDADMPSRKNADDGRAQDTPDATQDTPSTEPKGDAPALPEKMVTMLKGMRQDLAKVYKMDQDRLAKMDELLKMAEGSADDAEGDEDKGAGEGVSEAMLEKMQDAREEMDKLCKMDGGCLTKMDGMLKAAGIDPEATGDDSEEEEPEGEMDDAEKKLDALFRYMKRVATGAQGVSEKRGRVLSAANLNRLKQVKDDLKTCGTKLDEVIATQATDDAPKHTEMTARDAAVLLMAEGGEWLEKVAKYHHTNTEIARRDARAEQLRRLLSESN